MTIKLTLTVDPVDETPGIHITQSRKDSKPPHKDVVVYENVFIAPASPTSSAAFEIEIGDTLTLEVSAAQSIVFDKEQFAARAEDVNSVQAVEKRQKEAEELEKAEKEVEEDKKKRFEEGKRLDAQYRKEASEAERPVKAVPSVPPLPKEGEQEPFRSEARGAEAVPPKGGAKDSKEVKG